MGRKKRVVKIDNLGKKKLVVCLSVGFILLLLLIIRVGFLQFVQGASLKEEAVNRQLKSKTIPPSRGTIYDSTGKVLAVSAKVDTISVDPTNVKYSNNTDVNKEILAHAFSDIFELDYSKTLKNLTDKTSKFVVAEKVETDKVTKLQEWIKSNKVASGIYIDEDIKRYYPYNNLASNLIGFTGTENTGLAGLESTLNDVLSRNTSAKLLLIQILLMEKYQTVNKLM